MGSRLVITGANGYIGAALCRLALARGYGLTILGAAPDLGGDAPNLQAHPWRLGEAVPPTVLQGAAAVIHLAHAWSADAVGANPANPNFSGTEMLAREAFAAGCPRFIFVSTTSAHAEALNTYGKIKRTTEEALLARYPGQVLVARLGLVYGGKPRGLFGLLSKLVTLFPVLPMVGGATRLQPIHVDEVASGLLTLVSLARPDRPRYVLAHPDSISFADYLRLLRRVATGRGLWLMPIPVGLALFMCDLTRFVPLFPTISRERVYGLIAARPMPSADDLRALGLVVAQPQLGLSRVPRSGRRRLIAEARALLRYLGMPLPVAGVRVLVRAMERNDGAEPLYLSSSILRWPSLLRWVDPLPRRAGVPLVRRLEMAMALQAVAAPCARPGFTRLAAQAMLEVLAMPARLLSGILLK